MSTCTGTPATRSCAGYHRDFVGDLVFNRDGIVDVYPDLAERVERDYDFTEPVA